VRPAFGQHFDPALIDPVEDVNLVRDARVVGGALPTELEVREESREIVLTLCSPTYCSSRQSLILNAHIMSTTSAVDGGLIPKLFCGAAVVSRGTRSPSGESVITTQLTCENYSDSATCDGLGHGLDGLGQTPM
jgi:hypothetical protein